MERIKLMLNLRQRLVLLACAAVFGYALTAIISYLMVSRFSAESTMAMRIVAMAQDVFMLILPALITALLVTRRPADLLCLRERPELPVVVVSMLVLALATPAMNCLIEWNESIRLPQSMAGFEAKMKAMEETARGSIEVLQGGSGWSDLLMSFLIIGLAAGFSEELFFRGTFLRLLTTGRVSRQAAVWIVAVVFSLIHFQFYGFVPRMLLGAYFGYLLVWTRSLWVPVIVHAFNNTAYVLAGWLAQRQGIAETGLDTIGRGADWPYALVSLVLTAAAMVWLYKLCRRQEA